MRKWLQMVMGSVLLCAGAAQAQDVKGSAYDFTFTTLLGGRPLPLSEHKGKVIMVVNTASECGFTKQFSALQALYDRYRERGFVIIGVPSNDFGGQEPKDSDEIEHFCRVNYGVTFPMTSKVLVSGDEAHPFYEWASDTLGFGTGPKWNFHKYLINRQGMLVDYFNFTTAPDAQRVTEAVEKLLKE